MWVLALDTTTRDGSVALVRDDTVVAARPGDAGVSHAERVPADLRALLAEAGLALSAIDVFAVATGPGGFTGLRIGLAAVQGLATRARPARRRRAVARRAGLGRARPRLRQQTSPAPGWTPRAARSSPRRSCGRQAAAPPAWPLTPLAPATAATPAATLAAWRGLVPAGTRGRRRLPAGCGRPGSGRGLSNACRRPRHLAGVVGRLAWRLHRLGRTGPPAHARAGIRAASRRRDRARSPAPRRARRMTSFDRVTLADRARRDPRARRRLLPSSLDARRLRTRAAGSRPLLPLPRPRRGRRRRLLLLLADLRRDPPQQLRHSPVQAAAGPRTGAPARMCSAEAAALGAPNATLEVRASNAAAIAMYEAWRLHARRAAARLLHPSGRRCARSSGGAVPVRLEPLGTRC